MEASAGMPVLQAGWLAELLDGPIPAETSATCDRCAMVSSEPGVGFHPSSKCCTYTPELHNFLVGGVLAEDGDGSASVRARIASKIGVTPLGLHRPRKHLVLYDDAGPESFGRSFALRCPHYLEDGRCGVWRHREATCATWFCKVVRGEVGARFWHALHRLLATVERSLAWWCVEQLRVPARALEQLLQERESSQLRKQRLQSSELDGLPPESYARLWGDWLGREDLYYRECARLVAPLRWPDVLAQSGSMVRSAAAIVQLRFAELTSHELPVRLVAGTFRVIGFGPDACRIIAYNEHDPVEIPSALLEILPRFDGRTTEEILQDLATNDIDVEIALLRRLVDLGVLVAA